MERVSFSVGTMSGTGTLVDVPPTINGCLKGTKPATVTAIRETSRFEHLPLKDQVDRIRRTTFSGFVQKIEFVCRDGQHIHEGPGKSFGILQSDITDKSCTVIRHVCPPGCGLTIFDEHWHRETEILICLSGRLEVSGRDWRSIMLMRDVLLLEPFKPHHIEADEGSIFLAIFVPATLIHLRRTEAREAIAV